MGAGASKYEGAPDAELTGAKAALIMGLMQAEALGESEAVLVEDDIAEVRSVNGICRSIFVSERKGMTDDDMRIICEMANLEVFRINQGRVEKDAVEADVGLLEALFR